MGGNYEKSVYNQLMEVMDKLNTMEADQKRSRREIKSLTSEVNSLRKENTALREEVCALKEKNHVLEERNIRLEKENQLLRDDNERMKRKLNNDSSNSSIPPSQERKGKSPNQYNGRRQTGRKAGAQPGHKGHSLTRKEVEEKIRCGLYRHRVEEIGDPAGAYVTRYRLDLEIRPAATEIRIHADENGKFQIPPHLRAEVTYGETIRAIAAFLYSEGVVANDRICTLINSISGDSLGLSTGSVYEFCRKFSAACASQKAVLEEELLNAREICTDATVIKTNGILLSVIIGISQGAQPIIGFNYGARKYKRVRETYKIAILCNMVVSAFGFILFQFFPRQLISLFGTGEALYFEFAVKFMRIYLMMVIINGVQLISSNFFSAIGKPIKGLVLSMTRQVIFLIPLLLILPLFMGIDGIMYAGPCADMAAFVATVIVISRELHAMKEKEIIKTHIHI